MKRIILAVVLAAVGLGPTMAQSGATYSHTLPFGYETVDGNYSCYPGGTQGGGPFNASTGNSRWQWTYGWNQFYHQHPVYITQLAFRKDGNVLNAGGALYPNVVIQMANLAGAYASHTAMSATFANNLDATTLVTVYSGPITIPPNAGGTNPAPFNLVIPLQLPFAYDPTQLRDLVIDMQVLPGATSTGAFALDGVFPNAGVSQNGHTTNATSATTNWSNPDAGPVVEVTYLLGNPTSLELVATTSGGGIGDLYYQYLNMPLSAVEGFTLLSTTPSALYGIPFGRGPLFGIYPNILTFQLLLTPASVGDPFHWALPALGSFPDAPIIAPPGTFLGFTGLTFELVGVALAPGGVVAGVSP